MMKYMRACWHKKRNETFKKILLPKLRILWECLAANENFVAHFCAQRLKELHFLFFFFSCWPKIDPPRCPLAFCLPSPVNYFQVNIFIYTHMLGELWCLVCLCERPLQVFRRCLLPWKSPWHISFGPLQIAPCHGSWDAAVYFAYLLSTQPLDNISFATPTSHPAHTDCCQFVAEIFN